MEYDQDVKLDLMELKRMHPLLPAVTAAEYAHRAALGLDRSGHEPGVRMETRFDRTEQTAAIHWLRSNPRDANQLDRHRITEDAAEAIALALVYEARGWEVRRRLQRGEHADWLLRSPEAQTVALEVSGIGDGDDPGRLGDKLKQVARAKLAQHRAACVVELPAPRTTIQTV